MSIDPFSKLNVYDRTKPSYQACPQGSGKSYMLECHRRALMRKKDVICLGITFSFPTSSPADISLYVQASPVLENWIALAVASRMLFQFYSTTKTFDEFCNKLNLGKEKT